MNAPKHGDYDPSKGWYSSNTNAWHNDPAKIGKVRATYVPTEGDRQRYEDQWGRKVRFVPDPSMDRLIQLRDSERREEREQFHQLAPGATRLALADYEARKAESEGA